MNPLAEISTQLHIAGRFLSGRWVDPWPARACFTRSVNYPTLPWNLISRLMPCIYRCRASTSYKKWYWCNSWWKYQIRFGGYIVWESTSNFVFSFSSPNFHSLPAGQAPMESYACIYCVRALRGFEISTIQICLRRFSNVLVAWLQQGFKALCGEGFLPKASIKFAYNSYHSL